MKWDRKMVLYVLAVAPFLAGGGLLIGVGIFEGSRALWRLYLERPLEAAQVIGFIVFVAWAAWGYDYLTRSH